jgi:cell wall-associated NlpC family hydrolase
MSSSASVVAEARTWLGTPFHHQARLKSVGVDCIGLVIGVSRELGLVAPDFDVTGYSRVPDGRSLLEEASKHMPRISFQQVRPGDVVVVAFDVDPQHFGILGDYAHGGLSIIHALGRTAGRGGVIETRLMFSRAMRFVAAFSLPGVD